MPLERPVAVAIVDSMGETGWKLQTQLTPGDVDNPFRVHFRKEGQDLHLIVHARRLTPQKGKGTDHHRPPGEFHAQMIFDGDRRGPGVFLIWSVNYGKHSGYRRMKNIGPQRRSYSKYTTNDRRNRSGSTKDLSKK